MPRVWISEDEHYPVYKAKAVERIGALSFEVEDATWRRWQGAVKAYEEAQSEMAALCKGDEERRRRETWKRKSEVEKIVLDAIAESARRECIVRIPMKARSEDEQKAILQVLGRESESRYWGLAEFRGTDGDGRAWCVTARSD
jgi:hypothetical protein